jgi:hypothetical protein
VRECALRESVEITNECVRSCKLSHWGFSRFSQHHPVLRAGASKNPSVSHGSLKSSFQLSFCPPQKIALIANKHTHTSHSTMCIVSVVRPLFYSRVHFPIFSEAQRKVPIWVLRIKIALAIRIFYRSDFALCHLFLWQFSCLFNLSTFKSGNG